MNIDSPRYSVVYIDKFADPVQSQWVTSALAKQFKLSSQHRIKLSSGAPVVIKQATNKDIAERLKQLINQFGGQCWIQELNNDEQYSERRQGSRRQAEDRRSVSRTNIDPDRRAFKERRKTVTH